MWSVDSGVEHENGRRVSHEDGYGMGHVVSLINRKIHCN